MVAYLKACRDLQGAGWRDPVNVAVLEKSTRVPADVILAASPARFDPNGRINLADWENQQRFFQAQNLLTYKEPLDLNTIVEPSFVKARSTRWRVPGAGLTQSPPSHDFAARPVPIDHATAAPKIRLDGLCKEFPGQSRRVPAVVGSI